jgi:PGF-CTERM protein
MMLTIDVENRADLEITAVEWVKTEVTEGSLAKVKVTVRNNGHSTVKDYDVVLVSGSKTLDSTTELTGLRAGKSHTYALEWKAEGKGDKVVQLKVDTGMVVQEYDETNNIWEQQTLTVTEDSPGFGAVLMILALSAAVVILRRRG